MNRTRIFRTLLRFVRSDGGSSEMTVPLLLTAAGAAMVGLVLPTLNKASDTAGRTFDNQVQILERGARTGSVGPSGTSASGFELGRAVAPSYTGAPTSIVGAPQRPVNDNTQLTGGR
jgi:hypothetical protein